MSAVQATPAPVYGGIAPKKIPDAPDKWQEILLVIYPTSSFSNSWKFLWEKHNDIAQQIIDESYKNKKEHF